jgi:diketogulonate reductase-like aldo/keto reductase
MALVHPRGVGRLQATVKLNDGNVMPTFGLGVFKAEPGQSTYGSVLCALKSGYRHIDTAAYYRNEADVGRAIQDSGIPREQIFVTTKLWTGFGGPINYDGTLSALRESLARLKMAYVDMYLIHSPNDRSNRLEQWRALEAAKADGLVKSIGVSNYGIHHLQELERVAKVPPATNQIELHPWLTREELVAYCQHKAIVLTAYSPLAKARRMSDPKLQALCAKYKRTPAQILIRWCLSKGFVAIPKSTKEARIVENMSIDFDMEASDVKSMSGWNCNMATGWDPTVGA